MWPDTLLQGEREEVRAFHLSAVNPLCHLGANWPVNFDPNDSKDLGQAGMMGLGRWSIVNEYTQTIVEFFPQ